MRSCTINFFYSLLLLALLLCTNLQAADYYWVGGTGNWNNLSNWSKVSGSTLPANLHTTLPGISDDVYFDANSFTAAGQTVTINVNAACRSMSWVGATNNPTLTGTNAFTLTVYSNLTLIPAMNYTFAGTVVLRGLTGTWTVTTAGQTLAALDVTAAQLGSVFQLAGPLTVTNNIRLLEGGFNTNGQAINAAALLVPVQPAPVPTRSLTLNGSSITITGTGTVLDLSANNSALFTLNINSATNFEFTNAGNITVAMGTLANFNGAPLNFSNPTTANTTVAINSNDSANPLQFGNINLARSNSTFTINSNRPKTYQNITLGDNINATFTGATASVNTFNGNITAGNYTVITNRRLIFNSRNVFNGNINIGNSGVGFASILQFTNQSTFNGAVTLGNNGRIEFTAATVQHVFNASSSLTLAANGWIIAGQTGATAQLTLNNITMPPGSVLQVNPAATLPTIINGTINITASCSAPVNWRSANVGSPANISIGTAQTVNGLNVRDLNNSGNMLTIDNGANLSGNSGQFTFVSTARDFYWIGGTGNWSDGNRWSLSSGGAPVGCTPNITDNVFFDANSFSAAGQSVTVDIPAFCNNMNWTGALFTPSLAGNQQLTIGGSLTFIAAMNQTGAAPTYTGTVQFVSDNPATITMAGKRLNNADFFGSGSWTLQDQFYLVGTLSLVQGTLNTNNQVLDVNIINAGLASDLPRTLNMGNAIHIVRANAVVLDLTGNNITFNPGSSVLRATGNGNVTINTGTLTKTLPPIEFITAGGATATAIINTGTSTNRITFGNITSTKANLTINGTTLRTFNNITVTSTAAAKNVTWNGSTLASPNRDIVNGTITFPNATTAAIGSSIDFAVGSAMNIGTNSNLTVSAACAFSDVSIGASSNANFTTASSFNNLTANVFSTFRFGSGQTFTFANNFLLNADCASWIRLSSTLAGVQTNLSFGAAVQNWVGAILQDINIAAGTVNATAASDIGNNTGFATLSANLGVPLYWIGGTGNWSDPNRWALSSGGTPSGCIPSPDTDVIFDNNSFPAGGTVTIDQTTVFAKSMIWSSTNPATLSGIATRVMQLYGSVNWAGAALTNNFLGAIELTGVTAGSTKTLNWGGIPLRGNLIFNNNNDTWQLADNLSINDGGSFTIQHGTVEAQTHTINLTGNWTISPPVAPLNTSVFNPGTGTVRFNGTTAAQVLSAYNSATYGANDACTTIASSPFYNLIVNKTAVAAGRVLNIQDYSISILNNFSIEAGEVRDNGNQIRGNTVGTIILANNTKLQLGGGNVDGSATVFPTCFTNVSIGQGIPLGYVSNFLDVDPADNNNAAIIQYSSARSQLVQGNITYGTLLLSSGNNIANKPLTAPITVNGTLAVRNNTYFRDMGFQITGNTHAGNEINTQDATNARIFLGSGKGTNVQYSSFVPVNNLPQGIVLPPNVAPDVATVFPSYPDAKVNLGANSWVSYVATATQQVRGNITYGNLEVAVIGATGAERFDKIVSAGALNVRVELAVRARAHLIDNGFQISRVTAGGPLTMEDLTQLILGTAATATQFPINFTTFNINAGNLTVYNAGVNQQMSTAPQYGSILLNNPNNALPIVVKTFVPTNPVSLQRDLTINAFNNLADNGSQISRTASGGTVTIRGGASAAEGGFLTLGNTAIATNFPEGFTARLLEPNSTVTYNASVPQNVAAFNNNDNTSYWNLTINSQDLSVVAVKTLLGATRVRGNLRINQRNNLRDNGFQLTGSATGQMIMEADSRLELDHVAANGTPTLFPLNYVRANINLNASSTVLYGSDDAQPVSSEPVYGNVEFRKFNVAAPLVNKTVQTNTTDNLLQINGNLSIFDFNHLIDNGLQITGTPSGSMLMENDGRLTLGTQGVSGVATLFPNQFGNINLEAILSPKNFVIFNSDKAGNNIAGQNTGGVPFSYGHVRLISGGAAVTKLLLHNVDIRGDLLIENNNTLDASASNFNITLGRHWLNNGGTFTARNGRVILNGNTVDNTTQRILTNNSAFYDITFTNALGFTMEDNCRITREANFTNGIVSPLTNQIMVFLATGTVAGPGTFPGAPGPSNNSFVNGRVQKVGNTAFMFPVGKVIDASTRWYAPAGITAPTDPATIISAEYFPVNPNVPGYNTSLIERPPLNRVSEVEYWDIEKVAGSTGAGNAVKITLSWDTPRSGGVTQEGQLRVAHWQNRGGDTRWWDEGNEAFTGTMTRGILRAADAVTTFSPFTLGSLIPNNPLPVELVFFRADAQNDGTVLTQWETATEIDNDYFAVERSQNGSDFTEIGRVVGRGTTRIRQNYHWIDTEPLRGISYYRLRQVDTDGTFSFSRIVAVRMGADEQADFVLYPNPSDGGSLSVMIHQAAGKSVPMTISDLTGRIVWQNNLSVNAEGRSALELSVRLPAGTYIATIEHGGVQHRRAFVVQ